MKELKVPKHSQVEILKETMQTGLKNYETNELGEFIIYMPEISTLRIYEKESQITPLGINGEGILKYTKELIKDKSNEEKFKSFMKLISWFDSFSKENSENEPYLTLKDRFIKNVDVVLDQRSTNEGFLFLLFYCALFISDETPSFFSIDNIDSALNPKLCTEVIRQLSKLALEHNKQVILTTHNPSILDGIDLEDPNYTLHVVFRNKIGETNIKKINKPQPLEGQESIKLSEAFMKGFIGGLPKNF
ncbi:AAA family ATPase [Hymenobacter sp. GOD-10R]|uniref:AAA family ATPase n=1 Tax=Hymenobacter sp. GOD-10R TaxID=3093922 RepID=UPI002D76880F|nr:AAA family ATPase [Hymenobacter sp. GOD-10R]WRQ29755.1 AAA family ATPase [Hymenobacter sp. GOD-10R]